MTLAENADVTRSVAEDESPFITRAIATSNTISIYATNVARTTAARSAAILSAASEVWWIWDGCRVAGTMDQHGTLQYKDSNCKQVHPPLYCNIYKFKGPRGSKVVAFQNAIWHIQYDTVRYRSATDAK